MTDTIEQKALALVLEALEAAPIIGLWEDAEAFKVRQDNWLETKYRDALAALETKQMTLEENKRKALALVGRGVACEVNMENVMALTTALKYVNDQHEAFRQEVSDAVEAVLDRYYVLNIEDMLSHLIIPKPKPDPLVDVVKEVTWYDNEITAKELRAALEARGLEIRSKNDE